MSRGDVEKRKKNNKYGREIKGIAHTITGDIRNKQLIYYGHVQRMDQNRIPKQILNWKPHVRRPGRLRKSSHTGKVVFGSVFK